MNYIWYGKIWGKLQHLRVSGIKIGSRKVQKSCAATIKDCSQAAFPNIHTLLHIVTSCECERNASVLRLHNYMRCTMAERLTALALMHSHYDAPVDLDLAVDQFVQMHPHKLELENIIFQ